MLTGHQLFLRPLSAHSIVSDLHSVINLPWFRGRTRTAGAGISRARVEYTLDSRLAVARSVQEGGMHGDYYSIGAAAGVLPATTAASAFLIMHVPVSQAQSATYTAATAK